MPASKRTAKEGPNSGVEPLAVLIPETMRLTGKSRSGVYDAIGRGELDAVKDGARTLVTVASIRRRQAALPRAKIKVQA